MTKPNRTGPGRPPIPTDQRRVSITVRLPRDLLDRLAEHGRRRAHIIEAALRRYLDSD